MLKYLAAFAIASIAGNASKDNVVSILKSTGASFDSAEFESVWPQLEGKNLNTLVNEGSAKLSASGPSAGGAAPAKGGAAPAAAAGKKEEKKEEKPESDDEMGFGLFD
jgi:large subunit ribosomal protein LP2